MSLIAVPFFKTDMSEKLEVADALDISDTRPINKIFDAVKDGASKLFDKAGGIQGIQSGISSILNAKNSGATGLQLLQSGLGTFGTSSASILKDATKGILDKAGSFLDLDPSIINNIKGASDTVVSQLAYGNLDDLTSFNQLSSLLSTLTGNTAYSEVINLGMESAVWGATLTKSVEYGQYSTLEDVKTYIDPEVYQQALIYSVPAVSSSGSLEALKTLMAELSRETILSTKTDFVKAFLVAFKTPDPLSSTREDYSQSLISQLDTLSPGWNRYLRNVGEEIADLSCLSSGSRDALDLFELNAEMSVYAITAPHITEGAVEDSIRQEFPLMVMLPN